MDEGIDLESVGHVSGQITDEDGVGVHLASDDGSNLDARQLVVESGDIMTVDVPVPASMATIANIGAGEDVGLLMAGVGIVQCYLNIP